MDIRNKTVFVPGGNGFLGSWVVDLLEDCDADVLSLSKRDGYDFRTFKDVKKVFEAHEVDAIINCAIDGGGIQYVADRPCEIYYDNVRMSAHLIEGARRYDVDRFVNPISNCTYPAQLTGTFDEDDWWDGELHDSVAPFAVTRKSSYIQTKACMEEGHFDAVNLLFPNMYGPRDHFDPDRSHALGALVGKFVDAAATGNPTVTVWGTGDPVREWLYVEDAAEALVRALSIKPRSAPINIGTGEGLTILELAEKIQSVVEYDGKIVLDESKPDGDPHRILDIEQMYEVFEWEPTTCITEGIKRTVEWYRNNR